MTPYLAAALIAYLLGSIPFGLLLTRLAGLGDIRSIGSGDFRSKPKDSPFGCRPMLGSALRTLVADCAVPWLGETTFGTLEGAEPCGSSGYWS